MLVSICVLLLCIISAEIYGNNLYHYAHQSDVIRLQKLCKYGGIYLDIDTICLRSFKDLRNNKFVLGIQPNKAGTQIYGLCNAVMLSEKNSEFALKWIDEYTTFRSKGRDTHWDEHSVIIPLKLAYNNPTLVTIIENNCFLTSNITLGGHITIGANSFIGLSATINQRVKIGEECIIGAGTLITKDVNDKEVYAENSSKKLPQSSSEIGDMI